MTWANGSEIWEQMCFAQAVNGMLGGKERDLSVGNHFPRELAYLLVIPTFHIFVYFLFGYFFFKGVIVSVLPMIKLHTN